MKPIPHKCLTVLQLCLLLALGSISDAQEPSDADVLRWRVKTWREAYCERDQHETNKAFDASLWRAGDASVRGSMVRDLICGPAAYGFSRSQVITMLGRPDNVRNPAWPSERFGDVVVYRILRPRSFKKYEPPVPPGYRRIPEGYDVRVDFDPVNGEAIWFDVLPAVEGDS